MPITLTVQGHEELIASLQNLSDRLQGPEVVETLAKETSIIMAQNTPVGEYGMTRGILQRTMSEVGGPEATAGGGWWAGVGNLAGIYPLEAAPKGTIKAFLEGIRRFRKRAARSHKHFFDAKQAWRFLSKKEKEGLQLAREQGRYGGSIPFRPKYWFIQERGMPEVGIPTAQKFVEKTITAIKGRLNRILSSILVSRGPVA